MKGDIMLITTAAEIAGQPVQQTLGLVSGSAVMSKHVGRDIAAGIKSVFGGELRGYTEMLEDAREKATNRLIAAAERLGGNAVVAVRFSTSQVMPGATEIYVYGTAVRV